MGKPHRHNLYDQIGMLWCASWHNSPATKKCTPRTCTAGIYITCQPLRQQISRTRKAYLTCREHATQIKSKWRAYPKGGRRYTTHLNSTEHNAYTLHVYVCQRTVGWFLEHSHTLQYRVNSQYKWIVLTCFNYWSLSFEIFIYNNSYYFHWLFQSRNIRKNNTFPQYNIQTTQIYSIHYNMLAINLITWW